tara:strand:+ start:5853 stop:6680 length:828 start_codon:yes stop_codon:yes gene_type:complete
MDNKNDNIFEILWIRHGESQGNENPEMYQLGDPQVALTDEGIRQGIRAGVFLAEYLEDTGNAQDDPLFVAGEFMRHRQTYGAIWQGMGMDGAPPERFDSRLNEQSFGVLPFMIGKDGDYETLSRAYSKQVRDVNPFSASALHGESARDTSAHIKSFIDGTLKRDMDEGHKRIVVITSGRVIQTALMNWFHLPSDSIENGQLKNPDNTDIISIRGTQKDWTATKIYDGPSGQACAIDYIDGIEPLSIPPVPDHIASEPEFSDLLSPDGQDHDDIEP